jgi:DNA-binding IclR family transcriptional regulator
MRTCADIREGTWSMAGNSMERGRSVSSKTIAIVLAFGGGCEHNISEIARLVGLPISTAHRLIRELEAAKVLERTDHGYRVGPQLRAIASNADSATSTVHERTRRILEDLFAALAQPGCTLRLGVLEQLDVRYIEKSAEARPVSPVVEPHPLPAHATAMGKALLAFAPAPLTEQLIARGLPRYTPRTITDSTALHRTLSAIRVSQVAMSRREHDPHLSAIAVPIFRGDGIAVAALELCLRDSADLWLAKPALQVAAASLCHELQTSHTWEQCALMPPDRRLGATTAALTAWPSRQP